MSGNKTREEIDLDEEGFENNDQFFSEEAKSKYSNSEEQLDEVKNNSHSDQEHQWSIPDAESGEYLNTLEMRLQKLKGGRVLGKSLRFGVVGGSATKNPPKRKTIGYSDGSTKKCIDYLEEEIDLSTVPTEELIGAKRLLESDLINHASVEESNEEEPTEFEDLQIKELEEESWHRDYSINEEEKQIMYDKQTGELKIEKESESQEIQNDVSDNEESDEEEEEEDEQVDEYDTMELRDEDEEGEYVPHSIDQVQDQEGGFGDDDWEAEFP